jgi:hypothetical protein
VDVYPGPPARRGLPSQSHLRAGTTGSDHHGKGQPARADAVRRRATGADSVRVNTASPGSTGPAPCHRSLERMVTDRGWRMEDKGCELGANRIPTKVIEITNGRAATVARPLRDEHQRHVFVSCGRNK